MEIERKFIIEPKMLPKNLEEYPHSQLEQAYIITEPVLRIRKKDEAYILTYKGKGFLKREEMEFPLTKAAYEKLLANTEGNIITKTRYRIPENGNLTIELDVFHGIFEGLFLAEVEFPDEDKALSYAPPQWFGREVTEEAAYHNSTLSRMQKNEIAKLLTAAY